VGNKIGSSRHYYLGIWQQSSGQKWRKDKLIPNTGLLSGKASVSCAKGILKFYDGLVFFK